MPHSNYQRVDTICPKCRHTDIWRDNHRQETYCNHCGYILTDNRLFSIVDVLKREQEHNNRINRFWKKRSSKIMGSQKKKINKRQIRTHSFVSLFIYTIHRI